MLHLYGMRGVSRLLFAWLLLAGMVSLLASSARAADGQAGQSAILVSEADKILRVLAHDAAAQPDEASLVSGPGHDLRTTIGCSSTPTLRDRETTGRFHAVEPAWRESAPAKVHPIRGPPVALRA